VLGDAGAAAGLPAVPPDVPLVLHINAPVLPAALLRLPRALLRGRRIIGYWAWELPVVPNAWAAAAGLVHDIWTPSRFSADALERLAPGRVQVVPHPVALSPPQPSALTRADFGLPEEAVIVLVSFSLASSFARKNPLAAVAAFRQAFGARTDRLLLLKIVHASHAPADLALIRDRHPIFLFGWTILHEIDDASPLAGASEESLKDGHVYLLLTVIGTDENTGQSLMARHEYPASSIRWNHRYVDILSTDANGIDHFDYTRFHDVEPLA